MNYIYDIFLNFNNYLYDIYEWNKSDNIIHVRKIPLFRVDSKTMSDFINNKIELPLDFLSKIYNKTELFLKNKNIDYSFLISDGNDVIAFYNNKYSRLLIEEEREVLEYANAIKCINIDYKIIKNNKKVVFKTRSEIKIKNYINKRIKDLIINKDYDKLNFLYLDCFNENIDNVDKLFIYKLNKNWDKTYLKLYQLLRLMENR
ncbi:MAG: DUF3603 family protein [Firmicutes bacterium]|nr:DUF3603 family protein [Bacillota bacterium]